MHLLQLLNIGISNLKKIATKNFRLKPYKSIYSVFLDGNFEASLILITELWEKILKSYINNKFVVAIPARDMLVFCNSKSVEGLRELNSICKRVKNDGDHLLSDSLYIRDGIKWMEFEKYI